jgi:hypothetical protein
MSQELEQSYIIAGIMNDTLTPPELLCPITHELMIDPVIGEDGYTYEREVLLKIKDSLSPITRQPIDKRKIIPNRVLKECIEKYKNESKIQDILKIDITDTIVVDNYKFELQLMSTDEIYIRLVDMQLEILYDAFLNISNLSIKPLDKFYLMITNSLNKIPNYKVTIDINNNKVNLKFSYTTEMVHLEEKISFFKNESYKVKEYFLINKVKKLEEQIKFLSSSVIKEEPVNESEVENLYLETEIDTKSKQEYSEILQDPSKKQKENDMLSWSLKLPELDFTKNVVIEEEPIVVEIKSHELMSSSYYEEEQERIQKKIEEYMMKSHM